jgi:hypothetical protein
MQLFEFDDDANITATILAFKANPEYDSVFVFWRPDTNKFRIRATTTLPASAPLNPIGDGNGPFNVLVAGLSIQNQTAISGLISILKAPGGLKSCVAPGTNLNVNQALYQSIRS